MTTVLEKKVTKRGKSEPGLVAHHPSNRPHGSTFQTTDGQVYCHTPWGVRKLDAAVGTVIHLRQQNSAHVIRHLTLRVALYAIGGGIVGLALGATLL